MKCPCYSGKEYADCCQPYHRGKLAPTPLTLMRSRFAAYGLKDIDYVMKTWDKKSPLRRKNSAAWRKDLTHFATQTNFVGLKILDHSDDDDSVTFHALLFQDGHDISYIEKSYFKKQGKRWLYFNAAERGNHENRKPA